VASLKMARVFSNEFSAQIQQRYGKRQKIVNKVLMIFF